jgi:hypothetical protein
MIASSPIKTKNKQMKNATKNSLKQALLVLMVVFAGACSVHTQTSDAGQDNIMNMINARRYTFKAQNAIPQRGSTVFLTGEYDLKVSKDTIIAFLPYYGQAYSAPMDPSKGGIKFTSTDFTYTTEKKKRGWDVTITPKDVRDSDIRYLVLSISNDGYGSLRVFSNNRDGITFSGQIVPLKGK